MICRPKIEYYTGKKNKNMFRKRYGCYIKKKDVFEQKKTKTKTQMGAVNYQLKKKRCNIGRVNYKKIKKKYVTAIYET